MKICKYILLIFCAVFALHANAGKRSKLTAQERKQGFQMLFDGKSLNGWIGDTLNYRVKDGCIVVTAEYGDNHNLYTQNEYKDFVFRFEFCFTEPGVNNGVGIRTPIGKDAAYYGMCEIQILDHDAEIYKNLADYQVHGSAYGLVPAKRISHNGVGKWNYEEIVVNGDNVCVTLNGQQILKANLRDACQGHNNKPEDCPNNPYTLDHQSHPGLFNPQGHLGFLGHGKGLILRNIRILETK